VDVMMTTRGMTGGFMCSYLVDNLRVAAG